MISCLYAGIPVCVAAGNEGVDVMTESPSDCFGAIICGAYDQNKAIPSWSNFGKTVTTFNPGVNLTAGWGTGNSDYYLVSGTSFSSPITAGLIVKFLKNNPTASIATINGYVKMTQVSGQLTGIVGGSPNLRMVYKQISTPICI